MKKISVFLSFIIISVLGIVSVSAVPDPLWTYRQYGDVKYDTIVDSNDALLIQKKVAEFIDLDYNTNLFADYNHDGVVSVADVTCVQQRVAGFELPESYGGIIDTYSTRVASISSDYPLDSINPSLKGIPITFTANSYGDDGRTLEFLVNGEIVQPRGTADSLTYTFNSPGDYCVEARVYNESGYYNKNHIEFYMF